MFASLAHENRIYCGVACKNKAQSEYWADIAEKKAYETAERLHRVLTHGENICIYCGEALPNKNGGRLFCGKKCLTAFHNRRNPYQLTPKK
jgi:ribosomal protein S27AE